MSKADEMFEKLGYEKKYEGYLNDESEKYVEYFSDFSKNVIQFWYDKTFSKSNIDGMGCINMQELKAIQEKCK